VSYHPAVTASQQIDSGELDQTIRARLQTLSSLASFEGQLGKWSRMDAELIAEHAAGIIATTGCPSGEVQTRLRLGHDREAVESAARWREIFGAENYFLELMDHGLDIERRVREGLLEIGRKLAIPPLATNDCHYVTRDAAHNHEALLCVQTGKTLSDPNRFKFDGDGYYLKSAAEMREIWDAEIPGACDSTLLIADRARPFDPQDTAAGKAIQVDQQLCTVGRSIEQHTAKAGNQPFGQRRFQRATTALGVERDIETRLAGRCRLAHRRGDLLEKQPKIRTTARPTPIRLQLGGKVQIVDRR